MVTTKVESGKRRADEQAGNASTATQSDLLRGNRGHQCLVMGGCLLLAVEMHPLEKLPPPTRAIILMSLLGFLFLGLFLVVAILLGGNWVRKLGKHRRGPSIPPDVAPLRLVTDREIPLSTMDNLPVHDPMKKKPTDNDTQVTDETRG